MLARDKKKKLLKNRFLIYVSQLTFNIITYNPILFVLLLGMYLPLDRCKLTFNANISLYCET